METKRGLNRSLTSLALPVAGLFVVAMAAWLAMSVGGSGPPSWWLRAVTLAVALLAVIYLLALLASLRRLSRENASSAARHTTASAGRDGHLPAPQYHDALTDLPGRLWLEQTLTAELARSRRYHRHLSLLVVDIDHFTRLNRANGDATGDRLLTAVGSQLRTSIRRSDHLARPGDDEFILVLAETPLKGALNLAEKLRSMVELLRVEEGLAVTVSVGATAADDSDSVEALIGRAEAAAMTARRNGGNGVATATF